MFPSATKGATAEAWPSDLPSVLQQIAVGLLSLVALACAHAILYHLHYILAPFILSGFLVFALEPSVDRIHKMLAGLAPPNRWCCCCMQRRWRSRRLAQSDVSSGSDSESSLSDEARETQILLGDQVESDWEGYSIRILDAACRFVAVVLVLAGMMFVMSGVVYLLASGALQIKDNWAAYQKGMHAWVAWFDKMRDTLVGRLNLSGTMDTRVKMVYTNVLVKCQDSILELVNMLITFVTGGVSFAVIVLLYMLFWLYQPLPIGGKASTLVQSYIWKKTLVSILYGTSVACFLFCLGVDLPTFFGLVSFCLYFVPEVGAFISMLAPVPLILLNGNFDSPIQVLIVALVGQVVLKLLIGNFLELRMVSDDEEMSLHPVWVLLSLNYFGFLWGPVGMLVSVPLLATLKSIVISEEERLRTTQPAISGFAANVLACLEGRRRREERRRSSWLLPFALKGGPAKGQDVPAQQEQQRSPDMPQAEAAAKEPSTAVPTAPKKTAKPEQGPASSAAADVEEQKLA